MSHQWIEPDWPAPIGVRALCSTRKGGHSSGSWQSMNLGLNCGDNRIDVTDNRAELGKMLPCQPQWLNQVHGVKVWSHNAPVEKDFPEADAQISSEPGQVCAVLTADCLPVLLCSQSASCVGVAHAGWRGLAAGVLENTVQAMGEPSGQLMAWLGPAISAAAYEVGEDVRTAFVSKGDSLAAECFSAQGDRWLFDLYGMARLKLARAGVEHVSGGDHCTFGDSERFFSYRRDGVTGRMASMIWLTS
jgi:YfiH family protein